MKHIQETLGPSKIEVVGAMEVDGPPSEGVLSKSYNWVSRNGCECIARE